MESCKKCGREMELIEGCPSCFVNELTDRIFKETAVESVITELKAKIEALKTCPVCDEMDADGLEACSRCYNAQIVELASKKRAVGKITDFMDRYTGELKSENETLKTQLTHLITAISALSQWRYERTAELHDAASWAKAVGQWCRETIEGKP